MAKRATDDVGAGRSGPRYLGLECTTGEVIFNERFAGMLGYTLEELEPEGLGVLTNNSQASANATG